MKQTEYRIIVSETPLGLTTGINKFLHEGWQCLGGVSISYAREGAMVYAQSIVRLQNSRTK